MTLVTVGIKLLSLYLLEEKMRAMQLWITGSSGVKFILTKFNAFGGQNLGLL